MAEADGAVAPKDEQTQSAAEFQSLLATARELRQQIEAMKSEAEAARAQAVAAKNEAVSARAETESVLREASAARAAAETAKADAATAKAAANAARVDRAAVESDRQDVATAKAAVESVKALAQAEFEKASNAASEAAEARTEAQASRDEASRAKLAAESASTSADAAQKKALEANAAASGARTASDADRMKTAESLASVLTLATRAGKTVEEAGQFAIATQKAKDDAESALGDAKTASAHASAEAKKATDAHNLSTTAGLAGAFNEKALATKSRERFWGLALIVSLATAAAIGWVRYTDLAEFLKSKPDLSVLAANVVLALLGVGAPVWLAWMSTRMISKNFALTEDYAYKASLAKAYVGFREQARGLDPIFEQRLFAAAITQLDANPVRFLSSAHPGSPLQDLLQQPFMQEALTDGNFKQRLIEWLKATFRAKVSQAPTAPTAVPRIAQAE
jgi:chemotaxis protein histidine kinase CheA